MSELKWHFFSSLLCSADSLSSEVVSTYAHCWKITDKEIAEISTHFCNISYAREYFFVNHIRKPLLRPPKSRFSSNFACVSHFFVLFIAVTARLQCETTLFHVLWKVKTQDNNFLFLFFKFANIWQTERDIWNKCVKFEVLSVIQFLSYAFAAVKLDWSGRSFLLVPNMVLSKVNIYEHRTKQTYESDTFQPLTSFWYYEIKQELNSFQSQCVCFWHIFFSSGYSACELWPSHQGWWTSYKSQWSATKEKVRV